MLRRLLSTIVALALLSCAATIAMEALGLLFLTGPADPRHRLEAFIAQLEASLGPEDVPSEAGVEQLWPSRSVKATPEDGERAAAEIAPLPVSLPVGAPVGASGGDMTPSPAEREADTAAPTVADAKSEPRVAAETAPVAQAVAGAAPAAVPVSAQPLVAAVSPSSGAVEPAARLKAAAAPQPPAVSAVAVRPAPSAPASAGPGLVQKAAVCGTACRAKQSGAGKSRYATGAAGTQVRPVERARARAPRAAGSVGCPLLGWLGAAAAPATPPAHRTAARTF
jgi:hypothetical protein